VAPSSPPKSLTQKAWTFNDGKGDMGDTPTQFLLVRGLDTMLQEENIAKGLMKLEAEPKRVLLIRDRKTKVSWGFAFIEYQDVSYAQTALEKYQQYKSFKIERSRAKISYCHPGVFVPVYSDEGNFAFTTSNGQNVAYWDEHGYASEWSPPGKEGIAFTRPLISVPKDPEMTKFYNDIKAAEAIHATAATIFSEPVMHAKPVDTEKRESTGTTEQQKKKRKVESVAVAKTPAAQLEKWATKRQELKGDEKDVSEFADLKQMCCLLCKRKFQNIAEIQKHERMSNLHKVPPTPNLGIS
jgi:RNA-binding protein 5/10